MRTRFLVGALVVVVLFACAAAAADPSGKWKAEFTTPDGQTRTSTFEFKVEGDKLTGTTVGMQGVATPIADGKIKGDEISFSVTRSFGGEERKILYKGKVAENEIQFTVTFGDREFQMTAKRVTT